VAEVRVHLTRACLDDSSVVETINRFLKRIIVRRVSIAGFTPSVRTIEKDQVAQVAREFQEYVEQQFEDGEADDDTLPMVQLE